MSSALDAVVVEFVAPLGLAVLGGAIGSAISIGLSRSRGYRPRDNGQAEPPPPPVGQGPVATDE